MKLCHFFTLICERNRPEYIDFLRCFCYIRDILMFICQTNVFKCVNMFVCLSAFYRIVLYSVDDAAASPHSNAPPIKNYSVEFCQILSWNKDQDSVCESNKMEKCEVQKEGNKEEKEK